MLLPVARWSVIASAFRAVVPLGRTRGGVILGLVLEMGSLGVFHVGMLVVDHHHVANGFGVALEHLPPQFDVVEAIMEVVDDVPIINFHNGVTVSEVPLDVITEGLIGLLDDAAQIPSGFGTRVGCLVVLDEGVVEVLLAIDGAGRERLEPVEILAAHHDREVGSHDVVVTVRRSNGNGAGAQPRLSVRLTVVLLDADWLEGGGPLDGPKPVGEGREAVEVVAGFVVTRWPSGRGVASAATVWW